MPLEKVMAVWGQRDKNQKRFYAGQFVSPEMKDKFALYVLGTEKPKILFFNNGKKTETNHPQFFVFADFPED